MIARSPQEAVEQLDDAFNRGDVEAVLDFYEEEAVMVMEPGRLAYAKAELRQAFKAILESKATAKQIKTHVIEADDIALFISKWILSGQTPDGASFSREFIATSVFRKQADGGWRLVIDNAFGPGVLAQ